jgi:hypothetical protein
VSLARRSSSRPSLRGPSSSSAASRRCDDEERRRSRAPPSDTSGSDGTRWARGGAHGFSWRDAAAGGLALGSAVAAMVVATAPSPRKAEAGAPPAYTLGGRVAPGEGGTVESSKANDRRGGETAGSPASQRFLVAGARQARQTERERQGQRWCVRTGGRFWQSPAWRRRPVGGFENGMRPEPSLSLSLRRVHGAMSAALAGARAPITSTPPGSECVRTIQPFH